MLDGSPAEVLDNEHVKPGKGQAFNRIKARNMVTGRVVTKTYPSGASVDLADVHESDMRMLYADHEGWHFMDDTTFDQLTVTSDQMKEAKRWLVDGAVATIVVWQGKVLSVVPQTFVELDISECAPNAKGDTVSGGTKVAVLETGHEIKVPLFIEQGEKIKIDTRSGEYVSRA